MMFLKKLWSEEEGQGLVEYGLIIALVALAVLATLSLLGTSLNEIFTDISDTLTT